MARAQRNRTASAAAVVAVVLLCLLSRAPHVPAAAAPTFHARPPRASVPALAPVARTSVGAVGAAGQAHIVGGVAPEVRVGAVGGVGGDRMGGGGSGRSLTAHAGASGASAAAAEHPTGQPVAASAGVGARDDDSGVLHVRQTFAMDGVKYVVQVPEGEPMNDVRPRTMRACADVGLPAAHCEQVVASLQGKYDRMMGLTHGRSQQGLAKTARKYSDPEYWRAICPQLHVNSAWPAGVWNSTVASSPDELEYVDAYMRRNGYFKVDGGDWAMPVDHAVLADCVVALRRHGWPGVFGYMFDEFWLLTRRLHGIVRHVLGDDALVMPDIWVFNIDPRRSEPAGWAAHRDRPLNTPLMPDGSASSINFWLPLTEATPLNGCMYILPRPADPLMPSADLDDNIGRDGVQRQQLQHVRALPSKPGDVLGWDGWVLHWGSAATSDPPQPPRISIAAEFQRNPATNPGLAAMNNPLMGMQFNPPPVMRLSLACKQVNNYRHIREALQPWVDRLCGDIDTVLRAAGLPTLPQAPGTVLGAPAAR